MYVGVDEPVDSSHVDSRISILSSILRQVLFATPDIPSNLEALSAINLIYTVQMSHIYLFSLKNYSLLKRRSAACRVT